jgi:hypothetical protein
LNANEVYAPQIVQRISEAEKNDGITKVIDLQMYKKEISLHKMKTIPGNLKQTVLLILYLQQAIIICGMQAV